MEVLWLRQLSGKSFRSSQNPRVPSSCLVPMDTVRYIFPSQSLVSCSVSHVSLGGTEDLFLTGGTRTLSKKNYLLLERHHVNQLWSTQESG